MELNVFIAPITMIAVEMAKRAGLESKYLAFVAVILGVLFGALYGFVYKGDVFVNAFEGLLYGAASSGVYDAASHTTRSE
nr:hypothetical protein [uncultured Trichococcus sp.]